MFNPNLPINLNNIVTSDDLLQFIVQGANIDLDSVKEEMTKRKIKEIVKTHHMYDIFKGSDGRWKTYIPDDSKRDGRRMIVRKDEDKLYNYLYELLYKDADERKQEEELQEKNSKITLEDLYPEWLKFKSMHTPAQTYITRLESDWTKFYDGTPIIKVPLQELTRLMLDEWAHGLIRQFDMTKTCYYNMRTIMNQELDYAVIRGIIDINPLSGVKINSKLFRKVKKKPNETQVFTTAEMEDMTVLCFKDFESRVKVYQLSPLALAFMFLTGVRIGELCVLKYSDLERENYIHIQRMLRRDTKQIVDYPKTEAGDREIYLVEKARGIIELCKARQKELGVETEFIFSINQDPITERCIIDLLKKYAKKLDILYRSSHKVRKTAGSLVVDNVNINAAREFLGHEDERTTLKYYTFDRTPKDERELQLEKAFNS